jgi:C-terminal processing protease CtpA/Prc
LPDAGFRLLALYRYWNIIEYWFPYRDVIGENWIDVLFDFVPRVMAASTVDEYRLTLTELIARINDTHANLRADSNPQPPRGSAELPVVLRFVEDEAVVTGFSHPVRGPATGLRIGDVIGAIDGRSVDSLVTAWRPFYPASNQAARLRNIALNLTRGEPGEIEITGTRLDGPFSLSAERVSSVEVDLRAGLTHDLPGETFQLLSDEVAYLKLSSVVAADVANYVNAAADADVLVVDIRNYPSAFMVFALGGRLVTEPTEFARFTIGDASNPGAFSWTSPLTLAPLQPNFSGVVVILVDETSLSQAEYTTMALRAAPNAIVVGSTTAGADGNVSGIPLPGGITTLISGIGVFYPDGTPTQRIGIVPDLEVSPTIAGIREGRDEVLEAGVSYVLGREFRLPDR